MEQIYPLAGSAHGTSSCASQDFNFLNYWVDQTVEKEILRGKKLQELKQRPKLRKEKYDVVNIGHANIYSEKRCKRRSKSPTNTRKKGQKNSPTCKTPANREKCPMRIAELSVPSKRHCIETWRNKNHVLPGIMIDRLRQHVLDLSPVVKIPDAIDCFKRHKNAEMRKRKEVKKKEKEKKMKRKNDDYSSYNKCNIKKPTKSTRAQECQYLCAIFGHKIAKELNKPKQVTLNTELQKISNLVSIEIDNLVNKGQRDCNKNVKNKRVHAEVAAKISIWIADILDETAYKILEDQLQDLEDEVGPVLDLIDDLVDNVVDVCEPEPEVIEVSSSSETYIIETSTETSDEQEEVDSNDGNQEDTKDEDKNVKEFKDAPIDNLLVEIDLIPEPEQLTENLDDFIKNELDVIINTFEEDILTEDEDNILSDDQSKASSTELEKGADKELDTFVDANDNFEISLKKSGHEADTEDFQNSILITDKTRDADSVYDEPELVSEDDSNRKVKFSDINIVTRNETQDSIFSDIPEHFIDDLILSTPNDHLLSEADESWPHEMTLPILRPSESVSKSITSLGKILEVEERISVMLDDDINVKVHKVNTETKEQPETKEIETDDNIYIKDKMVDEKRSTEEKMIEKEQTDTYIGKDDITDSTEEIIGIVEKIQPDKNINKYATIDIKKSEISMDERKTTGQHNIDKYQTKDNGIKARDGKNEKDDAFDMEKEGTSKDKKESTVDIIEDDTTDTKDEGIDKERTKKTDVNIDKGSIHVIDTIHIQKEEAEILNSAKDGITITKKQEGKDGVTDIKKEGNSIERLKIEQNYINSPKERTTIPKEQDPEEQNKQIEKYVRDDIEDKSTDDETIDIKTEKISRDGKKPSIYLDIEEKTITKEQGVENKVKQTDELDKSKIEQVKNYIEKNGTMYVKEDGIDKGETDQIDKHLHTDIIKDSIEQEIENDVMEPSEQYYDTDEIIIIKEQEMKNERKQSDITKDKLIVTNEPDIENELIQNEVYINKDGITDTKEQNLNRHEIEPTDIYYIGQDGAIDIQHKAVSEGSTEETNNNLEKVIAKEQETKDETKHTDELIVINEPEIENELKQTNVYIDKTGIKDIKEHDIEKLELEPTDIYIGQDGTTDIQGEEVSDDWTEKSDKCLENDDRTITKEQDIKGHRIEQADKQTGKDVHKIQEDLNELGTNVGLRPSSTESTYHHHVPTETVAYKQELDKISEEQATQVTYIADKKIEDVATQITPKDDKIIDEAIRAINLKSLGRATDGMKVIETADKATNTSFPLLPRADKSTSVVSQSLVDITKRIQDVKADAFSSLRVKPKVNYKVDKDSAPAWVTETYAEPIKSPAYTSPPSQKKESQDENIRLWCKDLENGFDNLELWNGWIESAVQSVKVMEIKKARICIDKSREEFVRDWRHLKKNVDADAQTWRKLNTSTQGKMKAFRKIYQNTGFQTPSSKLNKNCNCHT